MRFINKPKQKATASRKILYDVEEYIYGRTDYVTNCPFGENGHYTGNVNKVGALECNICKWQKSNDKQNYIVECMHPEIKPIIDDEEKPKSLFR